uniref:C-type lectin domain-containing protein n=1 Tax=Poecilia reticulata TaxID=8081 RepID=A0A3P9NNW6_POERE
MRREKFRVYCYSYWRAIFGRSTTSGLKPKTYLLFLIKLVYGHYFLMLINSVTDNVILIKEKMNWEDALTYCTDHHHDLVTITNMDDQRWIQEKVKEASTDYVWMGLRFTYTLDFWFWVSDEVVSYKNWALDGKMDDCDMSGAMETKGDHLWKKVKDTEKFNFICSKN